jgi:hypothetical protein
MIYSKVYIIEISFGCGRGVEWNLGFDLRWMSGRGVWTVDCGLYGGEFYFEFGGQGG